MLQLNWLAIILSGLTPMLIGALWYGPLFGKVWMKEAGMTEESIKNANMGKIYGFATLFSIVLAAGILPYVIHQMHVGSALANQGSSVTGSDANLYFNDFIMKYGNEFRTFKHGALHGLILGLFIALPIIGTNALFERKSWKYIFINAGYWTACAVVIGGIICQWA